MKNANVNTFVAAALFPLAILGLMGTAIILFFVTLPSVGLLRTCFTTSMNQVSLCPEKSSYVKFNQISPAVLDAVIASEDAAFYSHKGFDWHEIQESLSKNLESGQYKRGGSTISQQLVKNAFLSKEKSILRKLREAALTVSLEANYTKKEILEKYLNVVEFGPSLYGISAASQHYFQRPPSELNLLQSAFLAFLLPNPKEYHKSFSQGSLTPFAKKSVLVILRRLEAFHKISESSYRSAVARIDEFPWTGISPAEFAPSSNEDFTAPTEEQIQKVLDQVPFEDAPAGEEPPATPSSAESTAPAPTSEQEDQESEPVPPAESEPTSGSTWD